MAVKILVVGSGGREAAICHKIKQSKKLSKLFCAPGNAGIGEIAELVPFSKVPDLLSFAKKEKIDLTIVGPETPLVDGIVDIFEENNLKIFGPSKSASQIEASKIFAKRLMEKYNIPTAWFREFYRSQDAIGFINDKKYPLVIKADGLAAGKGVIIAKSYEEAETAIKKILDEKQFGDAGKKIIIEEFLEGEEASILCFTDGKTIIPMESSQDHKKIFDNDEGPNTGGMGAYSPAPIITKKLLKQIEKEILVPTIRAMEKEGCFYRGILYAGIMVTKDGPKVLEYNCRFGDPETQALLPRLKTDLVKIIEAILNGELDKIKITWSKKPSACVVLASGGYPGDYKTGYVIEGLKEASMIKNVMIFHAGTSSAGCDTVTSGGRVLGVTALGNTIKEAIDLSYEAVSKIKFEGMHYRKDIGRRALKARNDK